MQRTKWIAAGVMATVLLLAAISRTYEKPAAPSFQGPNQLVANSGKIHLEGESSPYSGPVEELYPNGNKKYSLYIVDGVKQGQAIQWYMNGKKKTEVTLKNGQPTGTMLGWHENGKKSYEIPLAKGFAEGIVTEYDLNGKLRRKITHVNGKKHGKEIGFDLSGKKLWEATWVEDKIEGEYVKFYPSGEKKSITTYVKGIRDGQETGYFSDGKKSWMANWKGETPVGTHMEWHETKEGSPKPSRQQFFSNGQLVQLFEWYSNGQQSLEAEYTNGRLVKQFRWSREGKELMRMGIETPSQTSIDTENPKPTTINPDAVGRRKVWSKRTLNAYYRDKDVQTILIVFGEPDQKLGDTWIYNKMKVFDPATGQHFSTIQFLIKEDKVLLAEVR
tara:strand:+ start:546 stop:1709 length:1164 start_codon:yes stop_codon:yes gene_type:complete